MELDWFVLPESPYLSDFTPTDYCFLQMLEKDFGKIFSIESQIRDFAETVFTSKIYGIFIKIVQIIEQKYNLHYFWENGVD